MWFSKAKIACPSTVVNDYVNPLTMNFAIEYIYKNKKGHIPVLACTYVAQYVCIFGDIILHQISNKYMIRKYIDDETIYRFWDNM